MPEDYVDDRHWGQKRTIVSGVRVKTKGGRLQVQPREKTVNHGVWRRVTVTLLKPAETFRLEFRNWRTDENGETRFDLFLTCRARVEAQLAVWNAGIKGLNGTVESDVTLQSLADCSFRIESRHVEGQWLPALYLRPQVHRLHLRLTDVDTRKAGPIGGWMAEELGNATRKTLEDLLQSQEGKILKRVRKVLAKNEDRLRMNLGGVESLWRPESEASAASGPVSGSTFPLPATERP
jgi:hypothetical protein